LKARDNTPDSPDARTTSIHEALEALAAFWVVSVVIATIAGRRININEFSLHHFYKNRLVRCYLGASRGDRRQPNPLTGFDPKDDILLSDLVPIDENAGYFGPYAIVNATLNLNAGSELAQQERKAAAFVFTPEFCGFAPSHAEDQRRPRSIFDTWDEAGYRPTRGYSAPLGPHAGSAMAISGAAANPNSGYSTSGPMAFLLTVFDARLGWWLGNPRWREASRRPGPAFALWYLFAELLGQTTARTRFVNLSDGGHFDNLGLYELVRRRCRYIIIGDGEQDRELTFGSLGGAIRKCRADFGVEIDIDPDPIRIKGQYSTTHCVIGTITYPEKDPIQPVPLAGGIDVKPATESARGWILYLKSSLTGDEPADVIEYRSRNPAFPHQSTADQFFSESQFESYRRLGLHIAREAFEDVLELRRPGSERRATSIVLRDVFQQLTTKWYAPPPVKPEAASRLNDAYSKITSELGAHDKLKPLLGDLLADIHDKGPLAKEDLTEEAFLYGVKLLELMENVFVEYGLEHTANRANPRNRGWMMIFRQWARTPFLYNNVWPKVENSYNQLFRKFIQQLHDEQIDDVPIQT
jgi:hypothetical protein